VQTGGGRGGEGKEGTGVWVEGPGEGGGEGWRRMSACVGPWAGIGRGVQRLWGAGVVCVCVGGEGWVKGGGVLCEVCVCV